MNNKEKIDRDFARDVWCIFGLPFDNYSIGDVCKCIDDSIINNYHCLLSTPNMDWVTISLNDLEFKKEIISSDICIIDGSPILWVAYLFGFPIKKKVAGSTLMEYIIANKVDKNYKLFFFGGKKNVAKQAFIAIHNRKKQIKAVGYYCPKYGSAEEISTAGIINEINKTAPDILLISLGAKKGMSWIKKNINRLNTKVISHVGRAIDFIAGTVKRAPSWMQKVGLEWLWRIMQQPILCGRYLKDGIFLIFLFITSVIPYMGFLFVNKKYQLISKSPVIHIIDKESKLKIEIAGICNYLNNSVAKTTFRDSAKQNKDIVIDFSKTEYVDSSFLGTLLLLLKHQKMSHKKLILTCPNTKLKKIFKLNMLTNLFDME
ncbi:MAG: WecB/TagA/CpsF family glycosyltransferase [Omnitrophica bacterium]|nr:WecB/TagA/CpsF family glycosyltransferase [Candidatus Omnitrophota bacterium]